GVSDDRKNEIVSSINGKVVGSINGVNQWQVEVGTNDTNGLKEICNGLMNLQEIVYADFDRITNVSNDIVANDPYKNADGGDWYLDAINAYSAWNYNGRFNNINIGIVDNGFDIGHEDLRGKIKFPQQWLEDTNSKEYHGTHVAGIIGAIAGNEKGITGLLWNSNLYCVDWEPIKKQEWNTQNRLLSALSYTVEAGSKVINYSLGQTAVMPNGVTDWSIDYINEIGRKSSVYMYQLLNKGKDFIVVQSAGNGTSGKNNPDDDKEESNPENVLAVDAINNGYFCSVTEENAFEAKNITKQDILDRIIIVGAAQKNEDGNYQQAVFSNGGKQVDICAPGTKIFSTVPWEYGNYINLDGTSMSAPMVTAVCGMVWSVNSKFTGVDVKDIVCNSYDENIWVWDNPDGKHTTNDNYRMLNAKLSVEEAIRRTDGTGNIIGRVKEQGTNAPISNREVK
ncbi:MAG: S8 family serine peptidase, partial [Eubacterium sp.]|nr:S8 family serine peptidase [Eubacterium sp.]